MRRRGAVLCLLLSCGHAPRKGDHSLVVTPQPIVVGPLEVIDGGTSSESAFELGIGARTMCVRIAGRVHCSVGDYDSVALASGPPVGGIEDATNLSVGPEHACIVTKRGTVHCFGTNASGELGRPRGADITQQYSAEPPSHIRPRLSPGSAVRATSSSAARSRAPS